MQILELDSIPRDRAALTDLISVSRRKAARSKVIQLAAGVLFVMALCILLFGFVQAQPEPTTATILYLPVILR